MIFFKKLKKHLKTSENSFPIQKEKKEKEKDFLRWKSIFFVQKKRKKKSKICNSPF